jgi:hypothetical protein
MRIQMFGSSLVAVAALVGCGGDDGSIKVPDAKVYKDAAIDAAPMCAVDMSIGAISLGGTTPAEGDWFYTPEMGVNSGKKEFYFGAKLDAVETTGKSPAGYGDYLIIQVVKGTAFTLNVPYAFEPDASSTILNSYAIILGDLNDGQTELTNFMWAGDGSITFTAIGENDGDLINATVASTTYKDLDENDQVIPGGCSTNIASVTMKLKQKADTMAREMPFSGKQWEAIQSTFHRLQGKPTTQY